MLESYGDTMKGFLMNIIQSLVIKNSLEAQMLCLEQEFMGNIYQLMPILLSLRALPFKIAIR